MHHVSVQDIGLPALQQPDEPQGTPGIWHPTAKTQRRDPNPLAFEVDQG